MLNVPKLAQSTFFVDIDIMCFDQYTLFTQKYFLNFSSKTYTILSLSSRRVSLV